MSAAPRRRLGPKLPELETLGANVRRTRMAVAMTQERLAELADLNIRTLQKIEAGQINILVTTVLRLQRALRCRWTALLPPDEECPTPGVSPGSSKTAKRQRAGR